MNGTTKSGHSESPVSALMACETVQIKLLKNSGLVRSSQQIKFPPVTPPLRRKGNPFVATNEIISAFLKEIGPEI
jgi:hypothetical protein